MLEVNTVESATERNGTSDPQGAVCPWEISPYRLVSWWDMERFAAESFLKVASNIGGLAQLYVDEVHDLSANDCQQLSQRLSDLARRCRDIGLNCAALQIDESEKRLKGGNSPLAGVQVSQMLVQLGIAISSEMSMHLFLRVLPERSGFYEQPELFGPIVNDNFPSTAMDIKAAGSCLACNQGTACVMHLMRVLEVGLNALARELGVSFERREWENVINDLDKAIKAINGPHAGTDWRKRQQFYSEAATDFRYFKNAWRNYAMHAHEHYDASEARTIFDHVGAFMIHLAEGGLREQQEQVGNKMATS